MELLKRKRELFEPNTLLNSRAQEVFIRRVSLFSVSVETKEDTVTGESAAPFFIQKPTVQKLVEGGSVAFHCQVGGNPRPHLVWKKNGVALTTGYRYKAVCVVVSQSDPEMLIAVICCQIQGYVQEGDGRLQTGDLHDFCR